MKLKIASLGVTNIIVVAGLVFIVLLSSGALASAAAPSRSTEKARIDVYSDSACTKKINSIQWGSLTPGATINKTVYIKNMGTTALTLGMSTSYLNPTNSSNYITCLWNRESTILSPKQVSAAILTLSVSPTISGNISFSMNIVVTGTQANQK